MAKSWSQWVELREAYDDKFKAQEELHDLRMMFTNELSMQGTKHLDPTKDREGWELIDGKIKSISQNSFIAENPRAAKIAHNLLYAWIRVKEIMNKHKFPNNMRRPQYNYQAVNWQQYNAELTPYIEEVRRFMDLLDKELAGQRTSPW